MAIDGEESEHPMLKLFDRIVRVVTRVFDDHAEMRSAIYRMQGDLAVMSERMSIIEKQQSLNGPVGYHRPNEW